MLIYVLRLHRSYDRKSIPSRAITAGQETCRRRPVSNRGERSSLRRWHCGRRWRSRSRARSAPRPAAPLTQRQLVSVCRGASSAGDGCGAGVASYADAASRRGRTFAPCGDITPAEPSRDQLRRRRTSADLSAQSSARIRSARISSFIALRLAGRLSARIAMPSRKSISTSVVSGWFRRHVCLLITACSDSCSRSCEAENAWRKTGPDGLVCVMHPYWSFSQLNVKE